MLNFDQIVAAIRANQGQQPNFPPVVGRAPPQQPLPFPTQVPTPGVPQGLPGPMMSNHMMQPFMPSGPYGAQALQLAGLLGNQGPMPQLPIKGYMPGRFMPGFRPGIDTPILGGGGRPNRQVRPY